MTNPVLVEVTRGDRVESRHRGAVVIVDARGKKVLSIGDIDEPVYPRSAVKAIQALPVVESGAADAYRFQRARAGAFAGFAWRRTGACRRRQRDVDGDRARRKGA